MNNLPKKYLFIDESGDAAFYAKGKKLLIGSEGFQPLLSLGLLVVDEKKLIHNFVINFQKLVKQDILYNTLKCVSNPEWYLHARNDQLEIRSKFTEELRKFDDFMFFTVLGRKRLDTFQSKHNGNESEFYFDLIHHLLKDRLTDENYFYQILLSNRTGNNAVKFKNAIEKAIQRNKEQTNSKSEIHFECRTAPSSLTPELSVVDYLLWALQRYILWDDGRYYFALQEKYSLIFDLYDLDNISTNIYNKNNKFEKNKASEFRKDGYL